MTAFDPSAYSPAVRALLADPRLAPLGPGRPNRAARPLLEALDDRMFEPHGVRDRDLAAACRAGLWLHHDFLDESHAISQGIETAEGSYWHALMHRREGDFGNPKSPSRTDRARGGRIIPPPPAGSACAPCPSGCAARGSSRVRSGSLPVSPPHG